jgi:hypothetical protein
MKDNETKKEFIDRANKLLSKFFGKKIKADIEYGEISR